MRLCAGRNGQLLNLSSLANDCGITHTTTRRWLSILEASFVVRLLRPHHANFSKRLIKSPKLYFLDSGLLCYGTMGRYHHQVHDKEVLKVGMNVHQMPAEQDTLLRDISEEKIEPLFDRVKEISAYRDKRDQKPLLDSFQRLHDVVQTDENMLEAVLECTLAGATMGEIAGILRQAWGTPYDPYGHLESPIGSAQ